MEGNIYRWPQAFQGLVSHDTFFYSALLHDNPPEEALQLAEQFNDLYHLFLNKFARLSQDSSLSTSQAEELTTLLDNLLTVRRALERLEMK